MPRKKVTEEELDLSKEHIPTPEEIEAEIKEAEKRAQNKLAKRDADLARELEEEDNVTEELEPNTSPGRPDENLPKYYSMLLARKYLPFHSKILSSWVIGIAYNLAIDEFNKIEIKRIDSVCPHCNKIIHTKMPIPSFRTIFLQYIMMLMRSIGAEGVKSHIDLAKTLGRADVDKALQEGANF